ncbi:DUF2586 family protein [Riemerella anatipestifer]|uniref:DUF2586 domain-containing protein n=1 Tax=Riemerella anatipestifer TaxID=34085 RepID=A0A1S7DV46_RIEAN|nr:DUF2586 family protein [Riemerella anatipestifer]AQY22979.1 hypothetical protein AB406_2039 [Riemerella anatipestifer]MBT0556843.1 hypothetical protein [Riemerella anatipestifer]MDY3351868.1 DUF2586 family protein [Riemerella anatipestifer]MDY3525051.1 DUF2586 family protein [Riemerella anatipestifer]NAV17191.1 hypothetical protein [Riemerella anatipestifer]
MSNLQGVNITKGRLGANRLASNDAISGIIISAVALSAIALDTPITVYNLKDVEALGITAEYDATNNVNCYRHLSEFYRMAGEGTELHLMLVNRSETMSGICEKAKILLPYAKGDIKQLAIAVNPTAEPVMLNGLPSDVYNAIAKAQELANWAYQNNMPLNIFLEGYAYGGNASSSANLRAIDNLQADKVSVVIGQDYNYAKTKTDKAKKYADVGTVLGVCSKAKVNQNIGENESFNITNAVKGIWVEPGLSSHHKNTAVFSDLQTLEDKGYIFGITYAGMAGVRINNDHTCTPVIVDDENRVNEHTIAYGRVMNKAVRSLRTAYLPKVKTNWEVDEKTGKLSLGTITALEDIGDRVFEDMVRRGEITYGKTIINQNSDLIVSKELIISYKIVPRGVIGEINGTINLKTQA